MLLSQDIKNSNQQVINRIDSTIADTDERAQDSKTNIKSTENFEKLELAKQNTNLDKNFVDEFNEKFAKQRQDMNIENKKTSQDIHDLQQAFKMFNDQVIKQQKVLNLLMQQIADLEQDKDERQEKTYNLEQNFDRKIKLMERTNKRLDKLDLDN